VYAIWNGAFALYVQGVLNRPAAFVVNFFAAYWSFTVLHDAVHNAVSPAYPFVNDLAGTLAGLVLLAPFSLFRQIHLCHHRYAGDHHGESVSGGAAGHPLGMSLDPDEWTGRGPAVLLPLRWFSIPFHYVYFYFRTVKSTNAAEFFAGLLFTLAGFHVAWASLPADKVDALVVCCMAPTLCAFGWLAYLFDYVPHRPFVVTYKEDPYRSTNATSLFGAVDWPLWNAFSMNQNMHVVHHIWPFIPYYQYNRLWRKYGQEMVQNGTRVVPLFIAGDPASLFAELRGVKDSRSVSVAHASSSSSASSSVTEAKKQY
jgi:beta-carotene hydroxylase